MQGVARERRPRSFYRVNQGGFIRAGKSADNNVRVRQPLHCSLQRPLCSRMASYGYGEWPATVPGVLQTLQSHYFSLCGVLEQLLTIKGIIVQWNCTTSVLHYSTELCCSVQ